ncbi:glycosyltransferase [cf. Phormidesmis sp. LEGE 11477]|uniref:glycosyltransferase n=1 Tax=cf. Phormidesmis sp. LEGE 11477 TaxID=1828680 RepID=UPI00187F5927|nr:glycosyltransferase [cf. Phormidesmis sp. LEGE 11477]MBE9060265.1 glycosyltransferase [cf. Phormidesmis sp. LEGE 11477]
MTRWIVSQLGAREHYAIPRVLSHSRQLECLITDVWVSPSSVLRKLPDKAARLLKDRYHPDLSTATVKSFTSSSIQFELVHKLRKTTPWKRMMARNRWFQRQAITYLSSLKLDGSHPPTLFTYSYSALELLRYAKKRGWPTVLGQIDPGLFEEKIVAEEHSKYSELAPNRQPVPSSYWSLWQQECELADTIIVNSTWSQHLLEKAGVDPEKIRIVPLVYTPPLTAQSFKRQYPSTFSKERPLRVLFLGRATLRKGIARLIEAIKRLQGKPIEFWIVGIQEIVIPQALLNHPQVKWIGQVPRSQVETYYRQADVFLFPTLSDGYGLTQLEAQAWKLPIIASRCCGEVVQDNVNGLALAEVSGDAIAAALDSCFKDPQKLLSFSEHSKPVNSFCIEHLRRDLLSI